MPWRKGNRLHLVHEKEATGRVAQVFEEVKSSLGIRYVPLEFQAFAAYPKFLDVQWRALKPLLNTREFFDFSARLQAEAYTYLHNYFKVPAVGDGLTTARALPIIDVLCHVEPAVLLLLSVQLQAFEAPIGQPGKAQPADRKIFEQVPEFVDAELAPAPVRRTLEEIRHTLQLPYSGDEQLALAEWPELLFAYWHALKPALHSAFHEQALFRLRESAWKCAQEIPLSIEMEFSRMQEDGVDADEIGVVTRLTEVLLAGSAASVLNANFAKIGMEGGNLSAETASESAEKVA